MASTHTPVHTTHPTLTANSIDTVIPSGHFDQLVIVNWDTTGKIYFTLDGSAPAVGADDSRVIGPGQALMAGQGSWPSSTGPGGTPVKQVQLISSSACAYTVMGI